MGTERPRVPGPAQGKVILLDTNALLWLEAGHRRARDLQKTGRRLYLSPISVLELQILQEAGRLRLSAGTVAAFFDDDRWTLDDPPASRWVATSLTIGWTRDVFDRLIVAHARLRGWRLATSDQSNLLNLAETERLEL